MIALISELFCSDRRDYMHVYNLLLGSLLSGHIFKLIIKIKTTTITTKQTNKKPEDLFVELNLKTLNFIFHIN